jgi:fibronectin type 3 domain-containing protein
MRRGALLVAAGSAAVLSLLVSTGTAWAAGNWTVHVATVNSGEAKAQALPSAPTATSACATPTSGKKVTVTWTAVTHATGYGVYQSNTSATGTYTLQATVTTTSWTSAALATGNYWYEVVANIGSNWASVKSAATAQRTISSSACS